MRVFLTGGTGYIGRSVLEALLRAGHDVTVLVRNNEKAAHVEARGAHPVVGNLAEPESYRAAADAQDGYIHAAFETAAGRAAAVDRLAIDTLLAAATRPRTTSPVSSAPRFVIYTSGVWVVGATSDPADEQTPVHPIAHVQWRPAHEQIVLDAATEHLRTLVVRPGVVYGGGQGIVGDLFKSAANGLVRVVGEGNNHWPLVYDRDLADLYARLVAREDASGIYHATDEGDERVNDIVEAIAPYLPMRPDVRHVPIEEARHKMGTYADALALDQIIRSPRARAIGWTPSLHSVVSNAARLLEEWRNSK
ncbi:MAG: NAD-dependent epimerase/dehydratase family protein [Acidobacteriaceae bacterium]|jgi:nucleoside-diphosphate-sugar epimerase|nr:NAD-dependent epimerase/dehydratase family protein [Acidobacteriaceae bacterium]